MAKEVVAAKKEKMTIRQLLDTNEVKQGFNAVAGKHLTADKMLKLCVSAVKATPKLAQASPTSVLGAMMTSMALGLEPNTALGHAYLIPYDNNRKQPDGSWQKETECQFQIGYKGYIALALRQPDIASISADVIRDGDEIDYCEGTEEYLRHKKDLRGDGDIVAAYCVVTFIDKHGNKTPRVTLLPLSKIHQVREQSDTWKSLKKKSEEASAAEWVKKKFQDTPWEKWFDQMAIKTAIKQATKQLDLGGHMAMAATMENASADGRMDMGALGDSVLEGHAEHVNEVIEGNEPVPGTTIDNETGEVLEPGGEGELEPEEKPKDKKPKDKKPTAKKAAAKKTPEPEPDEQEQADADEPEPEQEEDDEQPAGDDEDEDFFNKGDD